MFYSRALSCCDVLEGRIGQRGHEMSERDDQHGRSVYVWIENQWSQRWGQRPPGGARKTKAAKKPTRFMSNSHLVLEELCRTCDGKHAHQFLLDCRAKAVAIYPEGLCQAICQGLVRQLAQKKAKVKSLFKVSAETKVGEKPEEEEHEQEAEQP